MPFCGNCVVEAMGLTAADKLSPLLNPGKMSIIGVFEQCPGSAEKGFIEKAELFHPARI